MIDIIGRLRRLKDAIREQGIVLYDDFNDDSKDADIWGTDTIVGSTTISETSKVTRFANDGLGTLGYSDRPSIESFGKSLVIEADITLTIGTGTSNEAYIELYKDANNYFRFGLYRSAATDSRGRITYEIAGVGPTTTDVDTTDTDAVSRNYRIIVDEHNVHVYLERQLLATIAFEELDNYIIRMEAGTTANGDTLEVDFNNFHVFSYWEQDQETYRRIESIQGGSESIQTLWNTLNNLLDLARHPDSGYTAMDGTEVTLIDIAAQDTPFEYSGGTIKTHMLQAGDTVIIKPYAMPRSGGSYNNPLDIITLANAQTQDVNLPSFYNQFGIKVTAEQTSSHGIDSAQAKDNVAYTDETIAANNALPANDMTLLPAAPVVDQDAYYFGGAHPFGLLRLNIGTAGAGAWDITWKYYNGTSWVALSGVTDGTTHFRAAAGSHDVTFTIPSDWAAVAVNGVTAYYIMADLTAFANLVTQPLGTQAWCYIAMLHDQYDSRR